MQNLGAKDMATSVSDTNEGSRGWYFGFNDKQGFAYDGTVFSPVRVVPTVKYTANWLIENDPCASALGAGWRVPTHPELNTAFTGVTKLDNAFTQYKFRAAGNYNSGSLSSPVNIYFSQTTKIYLYTSTMQSSTTGKVVSAETAAIMLNDYFGYDTGLNVRCVKTIL